MSRKRGKDKQAKQGVPDEILAEGSGPNEVIEADAQALADAAAKAVQSKRGRKAKQVVDAWGQPVGAVEGDDATAKEADDDAASELIEAAEQGADEAGSEQEASGEVGEQDASADAGADDASAKPRAKVGKKADKRAAKSKTNTKSRKTRGASADDESSESAADGDDDGLETSGSTGADDELESSASGETSDELAADADAELTNDAGDDLAADAADTEPSEESRSEEALEDAVLRAEAEAELSAAGEAAEAAGEGEGGEDGQGAALPTTAGSMDAAQLKNLVEALVFAADKPVTLQRLRQLTRVSEVKRLEQALAEIAVDYQNRGIALQQVSGGYQFRTNTQYSVWVQQLIAGRPVRLSRAQLETLAIVAYRQPITRPEVDEIRGVDSSATLRLLLERSLIRVLGKKEEVGRPVLYGTTKDFLDFFSLSDLRELPTLREYSELTAESRKVMSDRLGIDADGNAVDEDGNPVDADGNPIDDGTDVLPDAPVDSMSASVDPGAEDDAAIEAVSAVASVIGMEEERLDLSDEDFARSPSEEPIEMASNEAPVETSSSDEPVELASSEEPMEMASAEEPAETTSTSSSDEPMEMASAEEPAEMTSTSSSDEPMEMASAEEPDETTSREESIETASSEESIEVLSSDVDLGMPRGASQDDIVDMPEASSDSPSEILASAHDAAHDRDQPSAGESEEAAPDAESPSAELLDASSSQSLDETDKSPAE